MSQPPAFPAIYGSKSPYVSGELNMAVQVFPGLVPQVDQLVTDNGDEFHLAKLAGTIPIQYKQQVYYIPIEVWLPTNVPEIPPICYVRPAAGMQVPDGHPFVTRDGLCHLERAGPWTRAPLVTVLQQLVSVFSAHPPVFSVPSTPTTYTQPQPSPTHVQSQQISPPSIPGAGAGAAISSGQGSVASFRGGDVDAPPTYQQHVQQQSFSQVGPSTPTTQQQQQIQQLQQLQQQQQLIQQQQQQQLARKLQLQQALHARLRALEEQAENTQAQLTITQSNLETHAQTLETLEKELSQDSSRITETVQLLKPCIKELEQQMLQQKQSFGSQSIDELVEFQETQRCNVVAEDFAQEDCLFELGKALAKGTIDLEFYLKQTRAILRQQFYARAMCLKLQSMRL